MPASRVREQAIVNVEIEKQLYNVQRLYVEYENWLGFTFDQFDEYVKMLGRFTSNGFEADGMLYNLLQRLLDFNIAFEDTTVDEQIQGWIDQVKEFLSTLDPNSDAYKQLKALLDDLEARFAAVRRELDKTVIGTKAWWAWLQAISKYVADHPVPDDPGGGGGSFHSGGLVTAHNGYNTLGDEVIAKLQKGEIVINRAVVNQVGASSLMELNRTGRMDTGGGSESKNVYVIIREPGPRTTAEIAEGVYPVIKDKQRNYEPRNPYSE
jgi:hypothetical protein